MSNRFDESVGDVPPQELPALLTRSIRAVQHIWPRKVGVALFVFDLGPGGGLTYASNANRQDMTRTVGEWLRLQKIEHGGYTPRAPDADMQALLLAAFTKGDVRIGNDSEAERKAFADELISKMKSNYGG